MRTALEQCTNSVRCPFAVKVSVNFHRALHVHCVIVSELILHATIQIELTVYLGYALCTFTCAKSVH